MQSSNAPNKIALPFAASGTKNAIPVPSQQGVTPGAASFTDGFPPLTFTPLNAGGIPPAGADLNGIFNAITAVQQWQSSGGFFQYDAAQSTAIGGYPKGAVLMKSNGYGLWISTAENNATNPDAGGAGWVTLINFPMTLTAIIALVSDIGPVTCMDNGGALYVFSGGSYTPLLGSVGVAGAAIGATAAQAQSMNNGAFITASGLAQALQGANQGIATNGYQKLPGGLIIQWGSVSVAANGLLGVTYPITFPSAALIVAASCAGTTATPATYPFGAAVINTPSSFTLKNFYTGSNLQYNWLAIGS